MNKEELAPWIEKIKKAQESEREKIVAKMAKENSLKFDDALKLLELNGCAVKTSQPASQQAEAGDKKHSVILRHKTEYPKYRRAGLALTRNAEAYEVTDAQLAALKKDPWVAIGEDKKDGAEK
jgi:hypothetical protein